MSEQNPQTDRWTFPFDSTEGATQQTPPEKTERGRRLAAALPAIGARETWKAPLPSQAPPPTSVGLGATHGAFALKAFIAGLSIPAAVFAGVRLGAAPPPATPPCFPRRASRCRWTRTPTVASGVSRPGTGFASPARTTTAELQGDTGRIRA